MPRIAPYLIAAALTAALTVATPASAQVGLQHLVLDDGRMPSIVIYPTDTTARPLELGPYRLNAAAGAAPREGRHPLLVVSHGTGGSELGHAWLAERLARQG